jgi:hypothetical protein
VRDVCQGSVEWLLAAGEFATVRAILETVFAQQYPHRWQLAPMVHASAVPPSSRTRTVMAISASGRSRRCATTWRRATTGSFWSGRPATLIGGTSSPIGPAETLLAHCDRVVAQCEARFVAGTSLVNYGDGDWDDTLQPADPAMRTRMISAWTVGLAFHTFRQLAEVCRRAGQPGRADRLDAWLRRMRDDFAARLMPDGVVAGFVVMEPDGRVRPLLHPADAVTGIRYRLLPMTRSILAELFTPAEAARHLEIIAE